ncbi:putative nuclease HARBI1 [Merluccius polli]|uniref:Nuclease HARBI1 n=1 Tax=Merluccius polli TaxID=89951 RepID=A0AA47NQA9_MERPO|nr:putative nuclease HARBI1 [Merluccius polli]
MPGVVGAIDGTHIKIIAPSKDEDVFVNRNKVHSINTQIVFDATCNILDVVAKWPGSTHDPRILMGSGLRQDVALDTLSQSTTGSSLKYNILRLVLCVKNIVLALCRLLFVKSIFIICCFPPYMLEHTKIHEILWREDVITVITFIRFPLDNQQLHMIKANFMAIAGMAGVVGAVDGTHIQIIAPSKDEDVFVNRKKVIPSTRRLLLMQLLTFLMLRSGLQGLPVIRVF